LYNKLGNKKDIKIYDAIDSSQASPSGDLLYVSTPFYLFYFLHLFSTTRFKPFFD